jgi:ATP-dependent protease ClpP protease subunit
MIFKSDLKAEPACGASHIKFLKEFIDTFNPIEYNDDIKVSWIRGIWDSEGCAYGKGITLYNSMRELFNGRSTTYLDSTGFSMGAMLFSLGDERISYEDSSLMFHTFSSGYMGKGQELKSYVDFETSHFDKFFRQKIVSKGFLTNDEYEHMKIGKDFWFDSYEMAKRGICTHVVVGGYRLDNDAFIEYHDQDKDIDEWVINKLTDLIESEEEEDGEENYRTEVIATHLIERESTI